MAMMGDAPTLRTLAFRVLARTGTPRGTNAGQERDNLSNGLYGLGQGKRHTINGLNQLSRCPAL
jgi:hypothetical protein